MSDLKPCPFCGGVAIDSRSGSYTTGHGESSDKVMVKCIDCGARMEREDYANYQVIERKNEVKGLWNSRTDLDEALRKQREEIQVMLQDAFMAGQADCGIDPSFSSAYRYARRKLRPTIEDE